MARKILRARKNNGLRIADQIGEAFVPRSNQRSTVKLQKKHPLAPGYKLDPETLFDVHGNELFVLRLTLGPLDTGISVLADNPDARALLAAASWIHSERKPPVRTRRKTDGPGPVSLYALNNPGTNDCEACVDGYVSPHGDICERCAGSGVDKFRKCASGCGKAVRVSRGTCNVCMSNQFARANCGRKRR